MTLGKSKDLFAVSWVLVWFVLAVVKIVKYQSKSE